MSFYSLFLDDEARVGRPSRDPAPVEQHTLTAVLHSQCVRRRAAVGRVCRPEYPRRRVVPDQISVLLKHQTEGAAHRRLTAGLGATLPDDLLRFPDNNVPVGQDLKPKLSARGSKHVDLCVDCRDAHQGGWVRPSAADSTAGRGGGVHRSATNHVVIAVVDRSSRKNVAGEVAGLVPLRVEEGDDPHGGLSLVLRPGDAEAYMGGELPDVVCEAVRFRAQARLCVVVPGLFFLLSGLCHTKSRRGGDSQHVCIYKYIYSIRGFSRVDRVCQ